MLNFLSGAPAYRLLRLLEFLEFDPEGPDHRLTCSNEPNECVPWQTLGNFRPTLTRRIEWRRKLVMNGNDLERAGDGGGLWKDP